MLPKAHLGPERLLHTCHSSFYTNLSNAAVHVEKARELLGVELAALVGESYERAYGDMVRVQQLTELEEVISFSNALSLSNGDPFVAGEEHMP